MSERRRNQFGRLDKRIVHGAIMLGLLGPVSVGCGATAKRVSVGPELPAHETALLVGSAHRLFTLFYNRTFLVLIETVDDGPRDPDATEWALAAGPHTVKTGYYRKFLAMLGGASASWSRRPLFQTITFTAEAGHRYRADGHIVETSTHASAYCSWIEDEETHAIVGGTPECDLADTKATVPQSAAP